MHDYDPHDWNSHLLDIEGSMIREITARVLSCVGWSFGVVVAHKMISWMGGSLAVSELGHALIGTALGLLLVFRTNSSYDRFWEGRKQWGSIVNETRNLARAASSFISGDPELVKRLIQWSIVFPYATMRRLRGKNDLGLSALPLPEDDVRRTLAENNCALAVSRRMSEQIALAQQRGLITDYVAMTIDQNVQLLVDCLGACERIHNTPIPFAYMVHLRRAVILYCWTLPFALLSGFGWWTVIVTLLITYLMYGIEEIGVEIEDPFGDDENDLPLEQICQTIESNLAGIIATLAPREPVETPPAELAPPQFPATIPLAE